MGLVTPAGFDGIIPFATDEGVTLVPPYTGGVGGGATIVPGFAGVKAGLISNVEGKYLFGAAPPVPNRAPESAETRKVADDRFRVSARQLRRDRFRPYGGWAAVASKLGRHPPR